MVSGRRNHRLWTWIVVAAWAGSVPTAAAAQRRARAAEPVATDGFWIGFGLGGGWEGFDVDFVADRDRWEFDLRGDRVAAAYVRMGGTVNPHVRFGGELQVFWREGTGDEVQRANAMATALLYPAESGGPFIKLGFGAAAREMRGIERNGVAGGIGAGVDLRLGRNWFVTPNIDAVVQFFELSTTASLLFTLGFTWH